MPTEQQGSQGRLWRQDKDRLFFKDHFRSTSSGGEEKKFRLQWELQLHKSTDVDPLSVRKIPDWHFLNCSCGSGCLHGLPCQAIGQVIFLCGARVVFSLGFALGVVALLARPPGGSLSAFKIRLKCAKTASMIFDFFMGNDRSIVDGL